MKKIFIFFIALGLSSCFYMKGDYTLGPRNIINDFVWTYNIRFYNDTDFINSSLNTEVVKNYQEGKVRHAVPGGLIASSKLLEKQVYSEEYVRPTKTGSLVSYTIPVEFSDERIYKLIGESTINNVIYRLVEPNEIGDVILIDPLGKISTRVGRIYNNRLALLNTDFNLEPSDVIFTNEIENYFGDENIISSFEIRYMGIEDYKMVFKYDTVSPSGKLSIDESKTYQFPMYDSEVRIGDIKLEILNVDDTGIEYRIIN